MNTYPNQAEENYSVNEKRLIELGLDGEFVNHYIKYIAPNLRTVDESRLKIFTAERDDYIHAVIYGVIFGPILGVILAAIIVILACVTVIPAALFALLFIITQGGAVILVPIGLLGLIIASVCCIYKLTLNNYKDKRQKAYYNNINKFIFPNIVNFFGEDYQIIDKTSLFKDFLKEFDVVTELERTISHSVCFKYDDIPISITEIESVISTTKTNDVTQKKWQYNIFIVAELNKAFSGKTIITQDHGLIGNQIISFVFKSLSRASMEDPEFEKNYEVYTSDQVEARYLCTSSFLERFNALNAIANARVYAYFYQKKLFLQLIMNNKPFYLLPDLDIEQPQYFINVTNRVIKETRTMLKIIEKIKINSAL